MTELPEWSKEYYCFTSMEPVEWSMVMLSSAGHTCRSGHERPWCSVFPFGQSGGRLAHPSPGFIGSWSASCSEQVPLCFSATAIQLSSISQSHYFSVYFLHNLYFILFFSHMSIFFPLFLERIEVREGKT